MLRQCVPSAQDVGSSCAVEVDAASKTKVLQFATNKLASRNNQCALHFGVEAHESVGP